MDSLNRTDEARAISKGSEDVAEASGVIKQTAETLTAGEKIIQALDLADAERAAMSEYEAQRSHTRSGEGAVLQPPPKNPILAALGVEPEVYVLNVVQKVQSTALHDALLVLPFGNVVSLMTYLDIWAQKVVSAVLLGGAWN